MISIFAARKLERRVPFRPLILIFSVATFLAATLIAWTYLIRVANGKPATEGLSPFYWELPGSYLWILLFPLVYHIVRRNPLSARTPVSSLLTIHFFFAFLFAAAHLVLNNQVSIFLFNAAGMPFEATNPWCPWTISLRMLWRFLFYILIAATCYAVEFYCGMRTKKLENSTLLTRLQAIRLEHLKIRIDPVFVQRTLSDVGRLMKTNTVAAVETVTRLGSFFRLIQNQEQEITLAQRVQVVRSYFRVEAQRSEGRIRAKINIDQETLKLRVPEFLLQSLITNFYLFRAQEENTPYRLRARICKKDRQIRLILRDNLPWRKNRQKLVRELEQSIADNCAFPKAYRVRAGSKGLQVLFDPRFARVSQTGHFAMNSPGSGKMIHTRLWIASTGFVTLYFFSRRTLLLISGGNALTLQEVVNFNITLLLCGLSIPVIFFLAKKIQLRNVTSVLLHSALSILLFTCVSSIEIFLRTDGTATIAWTRILSNSGRIIMFPDQILIYWGIVLFAHAFWNYRKYVDEQIRASRLQSDLSSAQLKALEMQLHPHFLFNTLHAINGLILTNKTVAIRMLDRLQHFLQMTLRSSEQHLVPFTQELKFLECYLDIQKIRFGDRLNVKMDIDPETLLLPVPQLILQPIVENAIRHGLSHKLIGGEISLQATRRNGTLRIAVQDNGPGLTDHGIDSHARKGVGLQNSASRLYHLYGEYQRFFYGNRSEGGFEVKIEIPVPV